MRAQKSTPDHIGMTFGRLTVIGFVGLDKHGQRVWMCRCSCGREIPRPWGTLSGGNTKSCGCLHDEIRRIKRVRQPNLSVGYGVAARNAVVSCYRTRAKTRGNSWELSKEEAEQLINGSCYYCGCAPSQRSSNSIYGDYVYNGIDRIDNSKGYEQGNVVSCCGRCNKAKNDMSYSDFVLWIRQVYSHINERQDNAH